ncbi:hypothetical protein B0F87_1048 [Methylobacter tundripaludum]|uniref:Uncharacterized protein n=1 Tax=Methylobacter tundripaludum TaxID=173365 RepID=A0A2S6HEV3_9GAMM|nr:hypothetical protein [Methylobacter tundripaludum]PPK75921.1 hypothetical protein B0F87_1048 [Methylobacter tundripaludum]
MSESIILYLDRIEENDLHVFYNKECYSFEINDKDNIDFFKGLIKKFPQTKSFIEDTKEEFTKDGRSSSNSCASMLRITDRKYEAIAKEVEQHMLVKLGLFQKDFKKTRRQAVSSLSEMLDLFNFFTRFDDLINNEEYMSYAYYVICDE